MPSINVMRSVILNRKIKELEQEQNKASTEYSEATRLLKERIARKGGYFYNIWDPECQSASRTEFSGPGEEEIELLKKRVSSAEKKKVDASTKIAALLLQLSAVTGALAVESVITEGGVN